MSELFIPPPGAMQFYLRRHLDRSNLSSETCLWVAPPEKVGEGRLSNRIPGCKCPVVYRVIAGTDRASRLRLAMLQAESAVPVVVCACQGSIVE